MSITDNEKLSEGGSMRRIVINVLRLVLVLAAVSSFLTLNPVVGTARADHGGANIVASKPAEGCNERDRSH